MHKSRAIFAFPLLRRAAVLIAFGLVPTPALAQYIGRAPPPPLPAAPRAGEVESPAAGLARAVRTLAQSPRDFTALINAGRAALDLGDTQAAIGFFGRAEEVRPADPAPKIGMGAATVASGDASGALSWFFQAQQLGATGAAIGADRGLAQDLLGNQVAAQNDYRAALAGPERDEARRRLALSLGISGDRNAAFTTLQPLLMRRDPAAQRIRAFVLALVGDERGASNAIDSAMPGSGSRMAGFFRLLPKLSAPQKAAAVHLGVFPDPSEIRVAAVSPRILTAPTDLRAATRAPSPPRSLVADTAAKPGFKPAPRIIVIDPVPRASTSKFDFRRPAPRTRHSAPVAAAPARPQPAPSIAAPAASAPRPAFSTPASTPVVTPRPSAPEPLKFDLASEPTVPAPPLAEPKMVASAAEPAPTITPVAADRLSGIDRLLAQADELPVPPPPRPRLERTAKVAARDSANAKKAAEAKQAAGDKAARDAIGIAGSNWIQLAGGSHADRMASEFRRLSAKSSALRKRGGAVTTGKDYFRLLTGPFASKGAAQDFVNQLAKDGVDGFTWTRTPATLRIEKIAPK